MSIITLTSDYGLVDHKVAAIKGSILSLKEEARIVDITHSIQSYNLLQTAYIVRNAYKHFPDKTVHIISVDSFFHKERKAVLYDIDGHYFISADNGVLSLIFHDIKPVGIYEITYNNRFDDKVKFPSTDVFVPAAVHLANGGLPEVIGRIYKEPKEISFPKPVFNEAEKMFIGEIMYIDNFENLVTNISYSFFEKNAGGFEDFIIKFRNLALSKIYNDYTELISDWSREHEYHGKASAIFNDAGLLEICIYKGNNKSGAKSLFGLNVGEKIYIQFT